MNGSEKVVGRVSGVKISNEVELDTAGPSKGHSIYPFLFT